MGRARGHLHLAAGGSSGGGPSGGDGPRRYIRWTDQRITADLRALVGQSRQWPTLREFRAAGREDLHAAVVRHGGIGYWADRLGLELGPNQDREPYLLADAVREARALIQEELYLPGVDELRRRGLHRLATVVQRHGGSRRFCREFELPDPRR